MTNSQQSADPELYQSPRRIPVRGGFTLVVIIGLALDAWCIWSAIDTKRNWKTSDEAARTADRLYRGILVQLEKEAEAALTNGAVRSLAASSDR